MPLRRKLRIAYDDKTVTLAMEDGSEAVFEKADIALIRLALDF